jgi:hypothetical protein
MIRANRAQYDTTPNPRESEVEKEHATIFEIVLKLIMDWYLGGTGPKSSRQLTPAHPQDVRSTSAPAQPHDQRDGPLR